MSTGALEEQFGLWWGAVPQNTLALKKFPVTCFVFVLFVHLFAFREVELNSCWTFFPLAVVIVNKSYPYHIQCHLSYIKQEEGGDNVVSNLLDMTIFTTIPYCVGIMAHSLHKRKQAQNS